MTANSSVLYYVKFSLKLIHIKTILEKIYRVSTLEINDGLSEFDIKFSMISFREKDTGNAKKKDTGNAKKKKTETVK